VRGVKGFGERTEARILEGVRRLRARAAERRFLLAEALVEAEPLLAHLRGSPAARAVELAGSARRMRETVADLDVVAASDDPAALSDRLAAYPLAAEVLARGGTKTTVRLASGLQVDLRVVPPGDFATLLHHLTGSKAHHVKLRGIARDLGYTLSEWGLHRLPPRRPRDEARLVPSPPPRPQGAPDAEAASPQDLISSPPADARGEGDLPSPPPDPSAKVAIASEEELYRALGLAFVSPELREDTGEIEAARCGGLPADLVRLEDVRGFVHCHTTESDGRATLEEMARAAEALGAEYLTVTDHSQSAGYAGGLDPDRLRRQWDEIARVQERVGIRLLRGTESDILEDGALDYPDRILERLDVVVASVHARMKMDEDRMTRRLVRCMSLPVFKIWGHALGRLILDRPSFACRVPEVLDALAASRGAVEVNGDPKRLEMEPRWLREATKRRIPVVLSVDAHSVRDLGYLRNAITVARRGWVRKGDVLNTRGVEEFRRAVKPVPS
jgi:DNA polymerase (family 10)